MVELNSETTSSPTRRSFKQLAKDLALHIASARPIAVRIEDVPADVVERERRVAKAQVAEEKKPDAVKDKIVEGKLKKFYQENVLLEQPFVKERQGHDRRPGKSALWQGRRRRLRSVGLQV